MHPASEDKKLHTNAYLFCCRSILFPQALMEIDDRASSFWTQKVSNKCLFILTQTHSMQILGEIPFIKPQNDNLSVWMSLSKTDKWLKTMKMKGKDLTCFGWVFAACSVLETSPILFQVCFPPSSFWFYFLCTFTELFDAVRCRIGFCQFAPTVHRPTKAAGVALYELLCLTVSFPASSSLMIWDGESKIWCW